MQDGRFSLELTGPNDPQCGSCDLRLERRPFSGLRQHEASHGDTRCTSETGPCANQTVRGHRPGSVTIEPIARADVRIQSVKMPVAEGAGTTIVEVPWAVIRGTPLEGAFSTTSDAKGDVSVSEMRPLDRS